MLTQLEASILKASIKFWNYGDESEKEDNAVCFTAEDIATVIPLYTASIKGAMGSLHKKGYLCRIETSRDTTESGITDKGIDAALAL